MDDLISRQAAIDALENDKEELDRIIKGMSANDAQLDHFVAQHNQVVCDIDAIKHLPPTQPEPCEDAVSRKAVKEQMLKYGFLAPDMTVTEFVEDCLPPVTPKQRTGKWIIDDDTEKFMMHCSECGKFQDSRYDRRFLFCPHCGAKLEGVAV